MAFVFECTNCDQIIEAIERKPELCCDAPMEYIGEIDRPGVRARTIIAEGKASKRNLNKRNSMDKERDDYGS